MKNVKQYYKELGKLLYAIAIADGVVQQEEKENLHRFVLKELAHNERSYDSSGMNQAFYVDFEFEDQVQKHPEINGTIQHFLQFVETHVEPGDEELIDRSIRLMEGVSEAYSKKREKNIIAQVKKATEVFKSMKKRA